MKFEDRLAVAGTGTGTASALKTLASSALMGASCGAGGFEPRGTQMGIIIIIGTKSCDCASEDTVGIPLVVCGRLAWTGMPRTVGDEAMELETAGGVGTELGIEVDTLGLMRSPLVTASPVG